VIACGRKYRSLPAGWWRTTKLLVNSDVGKIPSSFSHGSNMNLLPVDVMQQNSPSKQGKEHLSNNKRGFSFFSHGTIGSLSFFSTRASAPEFSLLTILDKRLPLVRQPWRFLWLLSF